MSQKSSKSSSTTRSKSNTRSKSTVPYSDIEFVSIYLTMEDKQALAVWEVSSEEMWYELNRFVENGYKVSLSPDFSHDSYIISLTGKASSIEENNNRCLTSRGSSLDNALKSLLYKLDRYCPDGIWPDASGKAYGDFG